jgi:hypothetical protein
MKIEKGIPIPKVYRTSNTYVTKYTELSNQIEVGDSILFATKRDCYAAYSALTHRGFKINTRRVDDGFRLWCVDKKGQS